MAVLRQGMTGPDVRRLQSLLNASNGVPRPLVADGRFGALTRAAVVALQRQRHLTVDGEVESDTWKLLEAHRLAPVVDDYRVGPQEMLADIAAPYVGATEAAGNGMGEDQRMREIFEADDLANKDGSW